MPRRGVRRSRASSPAGSQFGVPFGRPAGLPDTPGGNTPGRRGAGAVTPDMLAPSSGDKFKGLTAFPYSPFGKSPDDRLSNQRAKFRGPLNRLRVRMHSRAGPVTLLGAFQADHDTLFKRAVRRVP